MQLFANNEKMYGIQNFVNGNEIFEVANSASKILTINATLNDKSLHINHSSRNTKLISYIINC